MNRFEFLRYVNLGQYIPTGSPLHRLDPRAKLAGMAFFLAAITFSIDVRALAIALVLTLILLLWARIPLGFALRSLLPPLPFLIFLAVLQVLFSPYRDASEVYFTYSMIRITSASLLAGIRLMLRFATLILALGLSTYITSTTELIYGLELILKPLARIGLPVRDFVMMIQVMLRFLPFLAQAAERIAKAQASRGADWGTREGNLLTRVRQVIPLIVPLFLTGLRKATNLAVAMEARGYTSYGPHSAMRVFTFGLVDLLAVLAFLTVSLLILYPWG